MTGSGVNTRQLTPESAVSARSRSQLDRGMARISRIGVICRSITVRGKFPSRKIRSATRNVSSAPRQRAQTNEPDRSPDNPASSSPLPSPEKIGNMAGSNESEPSSRTNRCLSPIACRNIRPINTAPPLIEDPQTSLIPAFGIPPPAFGIPPPAPGDPSSIQSTPDRIISRAAGLRWASVNFSRNTPRNSVNAESLSLRALSMICFPKQAPPERTGKSQNKLKMTALK